MSDYRRCYVSGGSYFYGGYGTVVKADERSGSGAKLNVVAAIVGGGIKADSGAASGHSANFKFKVPIKLPK